MIEFPRSLARQLWAVLRRAIPKPHGPQHPLIEFQAGPKGLHVQVAHPEVSVEYHQAGSSLSEGVRLPLLALAQFEGKGQEMVTLETRRDSQVVARWPDAGVPQIAEFEPDASRQQVDFPEQPKQLIGNPPGLLQALEEAGHSTEENNARYALQRILLRGRSGEVVATDGRQILVQGGFQFPFDTDLLVPHVPVFGCRNLSGDGPVEIGVTKQHVVLRVGAWSFHLHIDTEARYPQVDQAIPKLRREEPTGRSPRRMRRSWPGRCPVCPVRTRTTSR